MIERTKSYVFAVIFVAVFPLEPAFLACTVYVLHYVFQNRIKQLRSTVSLENIAGSIPCEGNTKMTSPFCLDTNTESPLKITKNAFYFTLKALFVLEIFKFLS